MSRVRELLAAQNRQITALLQLNLGLAIDEGSSRAVESKLIGITPQDLSRWLNGVNGQPWAFTAAAQAKITAWLGYHDSIADMLVEAQELEEQFG